ncbi:prolyl hydroxylase family protein [Alteromonas sp. CYL-A6]|uniref:prolyl hydroxylase family protein n=1 Tax=Alteromonas nitratireducens TaxID=3390813 RepID=UPI0034B0E921
MESVNSKWKNWVIQSLLRGQPPAAIARTLDDNGFCPEVIQRLLGSNLPQSFTFRCPPSRYQALTTPAFLRNKRTDVTALCDTSRLQLYAIDGFLSTDECEGIMALSRQKLKPSEVAGAQSADGIRTSTTCDLAFLSDQRVAALEQKIVDTLGLGVGENEVIQAQHYAPGQFYKAHYDFFPPGTDQFKADCIRRGQRTWTCMIYLNDNFADGHTTFTRMKLSVKPKQGTALIWNNLLATGEPNLNSIHFAEPVSDGSKMVVTKWFRDKN